MMKGLGSSTDKLAMEKPLSGHRWIPETHLIVQVRAGGPSSGPARTSGVKT